LQIVRVEDGYTVEGSERQPQDIKFLMNDLVREANLFPSTCLRIKPQSEGLFSSVISNNDWPIYTFSIIGKKTGI
jgi:hypothetical protein